jgi:hypothetical protein
MVLQRPASAALVGGSGVGGASRSKMLPFRAGVGRPERSPPVLNIAAAAPRKMVYSGGGAVADTGGSERNRNHAWRAAYDDRGTVRGDGGGRGGGCWDGNDPRRLLLPVRDGARAMPAMPGPAHCLLRVDPARGRGGARGRPRAAAWRRRGRTRDHRARHAVQRRAGGVSRRSRMEMVARPAGMLRIAGPSGAERRPVRRSQQGPHLRRALR